LLNADGDVVGVVSPSGRIAPIPLVTTDASGNTVLVGPDGLALPINIYNLNNVISYKHAGQAPSTGSTAQRTFCTKIAVDEDYDAVRLLYLNHTTGADLTVQAVVAATETAAMDTTLHIYQPYVGGSLKTNLDDTGDEYGWRTVTWAGASSCTAIAATGITQPTITASDWIPIRSVPRSDGGTLPLLMLRIRYDGNTACYNVSTDANELVTTENRGRVVQSQFLADASGVYVTAPGSNNTIADPSGTVLTVVVQTRTRSRGVTVLAIGDSITSCKDIVTDHFTSWGMRACADVADLSGKPIGFVNLGYSSVNAETYWSTFAKPLITTIKPDIAIYAGWTPNYGAYSTEAVMRVALRKMAGQLQDFIDTCKQGNIVPILWTGLPCSVATIGTAAIDAHRIAFNNQIRAMAGNGVYVADFDAALTDGAAPARISAAYTSDYVHPNIAGVDIMAAVLTPVIERIVGL
jgi:lysophospholipase L1-like esterase